jgi:cytochrome c-type biogenesis protein CcmF
LASAAIGALAWSLLTGNFALAYVADTTTRQGSWPYRLAGLWGGNGGSLLLWGWIILLAGTWATRGRPAARLAATAAGGSVLLIAAVAANPFQRLAIPAIDGGGLNPILQYPAMLYHPLLLYTGHAGLVAPFALAVAGLATGRLDRIWLAATRRWMLAAWLLLGVGLVAGAHWSYVELGWGGFWGWDPVENSGLLPWLAATAFLHAARKSTVDGDRHVPPGMAALAAVPFCFSLLGAAVSRSGAAQSVHAFAQATAVGRGLVAVLVIAVAAVVLTGARAQRRQPPAGRAAATGSQSLALAGGVVLLLAVAAAVAVGTAFPVLARAAAGQSIDVTARYYAMVVTPLAVVGLILMGVAPSLRLRPATRDASGAAPAGAGAAPLSAPAPASTGPGPAEGHLGPPRPRPAWPQRIRRPRRPRWIFAAVGAVVAVVVLGAPRESASAALAPAAAFAGVLGAAELLATRSVRRVGALMAHVGIALLLLGVAGSLLGRQSTQVLRPGGSLDLGGYTVHYRNVVLDQGNGWQRARTVLDVDKGGRPVAVLSPGLRVFSGQAAALSDVAIHATPSEDLIVAVRAIDPATEAAALDVTVRPLVVLVWWGGLLAAAGGAVVLATALRLRRRPEVARSSKPVTSAAR